MIKQRLDEPLRGYVSRFKREEVNITNCNQETTITSFKKGLNKTSDLYKELTKYQCLTMEDILGKAWAQTKWEEDVDRSPHKQLSRRSDRDNMPLRVGGPDRQWNRDEPYQWINRDLSRRLETWSDRAVPKYILSISPSDAVLAMKELRNVVRWPQKMFALADKRDKNKWCEFHANHGIEPMNASL